MVHAFVCARAESKLQSAFAVSASSLCFDGGSFEETSQQREIASVNVPVFLFLFFLWCCVFFFLGRGKKKKRWDLGKIEERGKKKKEREETNSRVLHKSYCKEVLIFVIYLFIYFWVLLYWCKQENVNADRSACSAFFFCCTAYKRSVPRPALSFDGLLVPLLYMRGPEFFFFFLPSAFSFIQSCCYVPCATYCSVAASKTGANSSAFFFLVRGERERAAWGMFPALFCM